MLDSAPPNTLTVIGSVRDFRERTVQGGHPDFEIVPSLGYGHYAGNVATTLGADRKPVFTGNGRLVKKQWKDSAGRPICYALPGKAGDVAGQWGASSTGGVTSSASFNQWFNDVPTINMSRLQSVTLKRQNDGSYVFDDKAEPVYQALGGFFPIENMLFGNPGGSPNRNFHFTLELHTQFTYLAAGGQMFRFIGDDDVFVFINNKLVIDIGGVHAAVDQYVDLNRLGLVDGQSYTLDFFFAERHRTKSNCRIQTNLHLENEPQNAITAAYD